LVFSELVFVSLFGCLERAPICIFYIYNNRWLGFRSFYYSDTFVKEQRWLVRELSTFAQVFNYCFFN